MLIFTQNGETEKDISSLKELVNVFESITTKPYYINYVELNINNWLQDNPERKEEKENKGEYLAFNLVEFHNMDAWDTLYGPTSHLLLADGSFIDRPTLDEITPDIIEYWENRSTQVQNPVIRLHYMGLVFTFKKKICNIECEQSFLEDYVKTIIEVSENEWLHSFISARHLKIAMDIAQGQISLLPIVKAEFQRLCSSAKDSHVGIWLSYFNYMLESLNKKIFDKNEKNIILSEVERRFSILIHLDPKAEREEKLNPFDIKLVAFKLAQYYKQHNDKANKERVIQYVEDAFRKILDQGTPMQQLLWLEEVQNSYFAFEMIEKAQSLYPEIQAKGIEVKDNLQKQFHEFSIPTKIIEALKQEILCGTLNEVYTKFIEKFTLKKHDAEKFVEQQSLNPLTGLMGTQILSESGMPLSKIGSPENDKEGNEFAFGASLIQAEEPIMSYIIDTLILQKIFTKELIVKHIMSSDLISPDRQFIIEKGIDFYFAEDFISSCHVLIPQIEHAICNMAIKVGANALRMQRSGNGYMVQLMDKLFGIEEIKNILGSDQVFYLRTLLTEQRGMNLRNLLCHGLVNPLYFNRAKADRIIHALLLIGNIKISEV